MPFSSDAVFRAAMDAAGSGETGLPQFGETALPGVKGPSKIPEGKYKFYTPSADQPEHVSAPSDVELFTLGQGLGQIFRSPSTPGKIISAERGLTTQEKKDIRGGYSGSLFEVHHAAPNYFGGTEELQNLTALPPVLHDKASAVNAVAKTLYENPDLTQKLLGRMITGREAQAISTNWRGKDVSGIPLEAGEIAVPDEEDKVKIAVKAYNKWNKEPTKLKWFPLPTSLSEAAEAGKEILRGAGMIGVASAPLTGIVGPIVGGAISRVSTKLFGPSEAGERVAAAVAKATPDTLGGVAAKSALSGFTMGQIPYTPEAGEPEGVGAIAARTAGGVAGMLPSMFASSYMMRGTFGKISGVMDANGAWKVAPLIKNAKVSRYLSSFVNFQALSEMSRHEEGTLEELGKDVLYNLGFAGVGTLLPSVREKTVAPALLNKILPSGLKITEPGVAYKATQKGSLLFGQFIAYTSLAYGEDASLGDAVANGLAMTVMHNTFGPTNKDYEGEALKIATNSRSRWLPPDDGVYAPKSLRPEDAGYVSVEERKSLLRKQTEKIIENIKRDTNLTDEQKIRAIQQQISYEDQLLYSSLKLDSEEIRTKEISEMMVRYQSAIDAANELSLRGITKETDQAVRALGEQKKIGEVTPKGEDAVTEDVTRGVSRELPKETSASIESAIGEGVLTREGLATDGTDIILKRTTPAKTTPLTGIFKGLRERITAREQKRTVQVMAVDNQGRTYDLGMLSSEILPGGVDLSTGRLAGFETTDGKITGVKVGLTKTDLERAPELTRLYQEAITPVEENLSAQYIDTVDRLVKEYTESKKALINKTDRESESIVSAIDTIVKENESIEDRIDKTVTTLSEAGYDISNERTVKPIAERVEGTISSKEMLSKIAVKGAEQPVVTPVPETVTVSTIGVEQPKASKKTVELVKKKTQKTSQEQLKETLLSVKKRREAEASVVQDAIKKQVAEAKEEAKRGAFGGRPRQILGGRVEELPARYGEFPEGAGERRPIISPRDAYIQDMLESGVIKLRQARVYGKSDRLFAKFLRYQVSKGRLTEEESVAIFGGPVPSGLTQAEARKRIKTKITDVLEKKIFNGDAEPDELRALSNEQLIQATIDSLVHSKTKEVTEMPLLLLRLSEQNSAILTELKSRRIADIDTAQKIFDAVVEKVGTIVPEEMKGLNPDFLAMRNAATYNGSKETPADTAIDYVYLESGQGQMSFGEPVVEKPAGRLYEVPIREEVVAERERIREKFTTPVAAEQETESYGRMTTKNKIRQELSDALYYNAPPDADAATLRGMISTIVNRGEALHQQILKNRFLPSEEEGVISETRSGEKVSLKSMMDKHALTRKDVNELVEYGESIIKIRKDFDEFSEFTSRYEEASDKTSLAGYKDATKYLSDESKKVIEVSNNFLDRWEVARKIRDGANEYQWEAFEDWDRLLSEGKIDGTLTEYWDIYKQKIGDLKDDKFRSDRLRFNPDYNPVAKDAALSFEEAAQAERLKMIDVLSGKVKPANKPFGEDPLEYLNSPRGKSHGYGRFGIFEEVKGGEIVQGIEEVGKRRFRYKTNDGIYKMWMRSWVDGNKLGIEQFILDNPKMKVRLEETTGYVTLLRRAKQAYEDAIRNGEIVEISDRLALEDQNSLQKELVASGKVIDSDLTRSLFTKLYIYGEKIPAPKEIKDLKALSGKDGRFEEMEKETETGLSTQGERNLIRELKKHGFVYNDYATGKTMTIKNPTARSFIMAARSAVKKGQVGIAKFYQLLNKSAQKETFERGVGKDWYELPQKEALEENTGLSTVYEMHPEEVALLKIGVPGLFERVILPEDTAAGAIQKTILDKLSKVEANRETNKYCSVVPNEIAPRKLSTINLRNEIALEVSRSRPLGAALLRSAKKMGESQYRASEDYLRYRQNPQYARNDELDRWYTEAEEWINRRERGGKEGLYETEEPPEWMSQEQKDNWWTEKLEETSGEVARESENPIVQELRRMETEEGMDIFGETRDIEEVSVAEMAMSFLGESDPILIKSYEKLTPEQIDEAISTSASTVGRYFVRGAEEAYQDRLYNLTERQQSDIVRKAEIEETSDQLYLAMKSLLPNLEFSPVASKEDRIAIYSRRLQDNWKKLLAEEPEKANKAWGLKRKYDQILENNIRWANVVTEEDLRKMSSDVTTRLEREGTPLSTEEDILKKRLDDLTYRLNKISNKEEKEVVKKDISSVKNDLKKYENVRRTVNKINIPELGKKDKQINEVKKLFEKGLLTKSERDFRIEEINNEASKMP